MSARKRKAASQVRRVARSLTASGVCEVEGCDGPASDCCSSCAKRICGSHGVASPDLCSVICLDCAECAA